MLAPGGVERSVTSTRVTLVAEVVPRPVVAGLVAARGASAVAPVAVVAVEEPMLATGPVVFAAAGPRSAAQAARPPTSTTAPPIAAKIGARDRRAGTSR